MDGNKKIKDGKCHLVMDILDNIVSYLIQLTNIHDSEELT
jgi:hypothetical protein